MTEQTQPTPEPKSTATSIPEPEAPAEAPTTDTSVDESSPAVEADDAQAAEAQTPQAPAESTATEAPDDGQEPVLTESAEQIAAEHVEQASSEDLAAAGQEAAAHGEGTQDPVEGEASDAPAEPVATAPATDPTPAQGPAGAQPETAGDEPVKAPAPQATEPTQAAGPAPTPVTVPGPAVQATPAEPAVDPEEALDAAKWGRVDGEGRVYVQDGGAEREVGQFPDAPIAEALAFYVRRFLDLKSQVTLFATRLPQLSVREIDSTLKSLEESLKEPAAVGDLDGLRARFAALKGVAVERREAVSAERAALKEAALAERTALVERAEAIAAQDPGRTQWKNSGAELRELLEKWKDAQRRGPRLDRPSEDGLWKRFSHARTTFDRHRRQYFSELDAKQSQVKAAKEALIERAQALSTSTDWAGTSARYRELMDEWKKAGRASRKEDDALWARFRAAQQVFFDARRAKDEAADAEFSENLKVKEALVAKAEALLPIKDVKAAKKALRPIQDAWDEAGRVPRSAVRRIEARMRAVEDAVREAENTEWRRTNPETKARAEGLAGQLQNSIAELEAQLATAQANGDSKAQAEAEAALTARRAWLDQVLRSAKA